MNFKLEDIVEVTMGQSPKSQYYNTEGKGTPFLQGNRTFGFKRPTFDTYTTLITKEAKAGDVIMSVRAPVGDLNITPVDMCLGRGVCSLRMKNGNQEFLYYMMQYYMPQLIKKESGTVFGSVNRNDINGLEVNIPENIEKQKKIARYLTMLDDKIELNNQIKYNLEQQAQAIYQQMFCEKSPNGKIEDIILENPKSKIKVSEARECKGVYPFFTSGEAVLTWKETIVSGRNCFLNTGGSADVKFYVGDAAYSTDTWCISARDELSDYMYLLLSETKSEINNVFFQGTSLKHLQKPLFRGKDIYVPNQDEIVRFNSIVQPCFNKLFRNWEENVKLASLRDVLLPKLMSGELDVSDVDI